MAQNLQERAHLTYDREAYEAGWDHIFGPKCECHKYDEQDCEKCRKVKSDD